MKNAGLGWTYDIWLCENPSGLSIREQGRYNKKKIKNFEKINRTFYSMTVKGLNLPKKKDFSSLNKEVAAVHVMKHFNKLGFNTFCGEGEDFCVVYVWSGKQLVSNHY